MNLSTETDDTLHALALEKRKNGNATPRAYAAQRELARRNDVLQMHSHRADGSTKRYDIDIEEENR